MKGFYYHCLPLAFSFHSLCFGFSMYFEIRMIAKGPSPFKSHPSLTCCSLMIFCSLSLMSYEVGHLCLVEIPQKIEIIVITHKSRVKSAPGPNIVPDI